jgi:hypothetical protein
MDNTIDEKTINLEMGKLKIITVLFLTDDYEAYHRQLID